MNQPEECICQNPEARGHTCSVHGVKCRAEVPAGYTGDRTDYQPFTPVDFRSAAGLSRDDVLDFLQEMNRVPSPPVSEVIHFVEELHLSWQLQEDLLRRLEVTS